MSQCYVAGDFKKYFDENMQALGLSVPSGLFDTYQLAVGTAATLVGTLSHLGKGATIGELIGATVGLEKLGVLAAMGAAGYTGAVIGSIAVASGRSIGCGTSISDLLVFVRQHRLYFNGAERFYARNPAVLDSKYPFRQRYAAALRTSPRTFEYA
jgi:hypothetical protein